MTKYRTDVVWCKKKPFCISWTWSPRKWLLGLWHMPYDGLYFWALHIGPICFHNDYEPIAEGEDPCLKN